MHFLDFSSSCKKNLAVCFFLTKTWAYKQDAFAMFFAVCNGLVCLTLPSVQNNRRYGERITTIKHCSCLVSTLLSKRLPRLVGTIKFESITFVYHYHIWNSFVFV